jgi:hypothetical protein
VEIIDQGKDHFRWRVHHCRAPDAESIRLGCGKDEYDRNDDRKRNGDDGNGLEHGIVSSFVMFSDAA